MILAFRKYLKHSHVKKENLLFAKFKIKTRQMKHPCLINSLQLIWQIVISCSKERLSSALSHHFYENFILFWENRDTKSDNFSVHSHMCMKESMDTMQTHVTVLPWKNVMSLKNTETAQWRYVLLYKRGQNLVAVLMYSPKRGEWLTLSFVFPFSGTE